MKLVECQCAVDAESRIYYYLFFCSYVWKSTFKNMTNRKEKLDIFKFLEALESQPYLWLKSHPKYKDQNAKDSAEKYLCKLFNFSDSIEVRKKIEKHDVIG